MSLSPASSPRDGRRAGGHEEEFVPLVRSRAAPASSSSSSSSNPGDPPVNPMATTKTPRPPPHYQPPSPSDADVALSIFKYWRAVAAVKSMRQTAVALFAAVNVLGVMFALRYVLSPPAGPIGGATASPRGMAAEAAAMAARDGAADVAGLSFLGGSSDEEASSSSIRGIAAAETETESAPPLSSSPYGALSCHLEDPLLPPSSETWEEARSGSNAAVRIREGLRHPNFASRTILVGGEDMRRYFIGLGCWGGFRPDAYTAPWRSEEGIAAREAVGGRGAKMDAKFMHREEEEGVGGRSSDGGQVLYSPLAGHVLAYNDDDPTAGGGGEMLVHSRSKSWLEACRSREPFAIEFYGYRPDGAAGPVGIIDLDNVDTVFLTAGTDRGARPANLAAIVELLNCMDEVRGRGWQQMPRAAKNWPRVRYVATAACDGDRYRTEEEGLFASRTAVLPHGEGRGKVLVAENVVGGADCGSSLFRSGRPDAVAADMVEAVAAGGRVAGAGADVAEASVGAVETRLESSSLASCPFAPDASSGAVNLNPNLLAAMDPVFDPGLLDGLRRLLDEDGRSNDSPPIKSVLDLAAGAGQLRSALQGAGALLPPPTGFVDYAGFDQYPNLPELVGRTVFLKGGAPHVVPPGLCWADPSRPFDLGRKFDLVLAVVGAGQFVRKGGEGAFLDNVARAARGGGLAVVAWNTKNSDGDVRVVQEMERRGLEYDGKLTRRLRGSVTGKGEGGRWLGKSLEVYRYREGTSRPLVGGRRLRR